MTPDTTDPEAFEAAASPVHGVVIRWPDGGMEQLTWSAGVIVRRPVSGPELWLPDRLSPVLPMTAIDLDDIDLLRNQPECSPAHLQIFWTFQSGGPDVP
jgi:hypothetical protein